MDLQAATIQPFLIAVTYVLLFTAATYTAHAKPVPDGHHVEQTLQTLIADLHQQLKHDEPVLQKRQFGDSGEDNEEVGRLTATLLNEIEDQEPLQQHAAAQEPEEGEQDVNSILLEIIKQKEWLKASLFYESLLERQDEQIESFRTALVKMRRQLKNGEQREKPTMRKLMGWLRDMIRNLTKITNSSARLSGLFDEYTRTNSIPPTTKIILPEYIQQTPQGYVFGRQEESQETERRCKRWRRRRKRSTSGGFQGGFGDFVDVGQVHARVSSHSYLNSGSNEFQWHDKPVEPSVRFDNDFWEDKIRSNGNKNGDYSSHLEESPSKSSYETEHMSPESSINYNRDPYLHSDRTVPFRMGTFSKVDITIPMTNKNPPPPQQPVPIMEMHHGEAVPTRNERHKGLDHEQYLEEFEDREPEFAKEMIEDFPSRDYIDNPPGSHNLPIVPEPYNPNYDSGLRPSNFDDDVILPSWDSNIDQDNSSEFEYFLEDC